MVDSFDSKNSVRLAEATEVEIMISKRFLRSHSDGIERVHFLPEFQNPKYRCSQKTK